jgi:hypothetical protein
MTAIAAAFENLFRRISDQRDDRTAIYLHQAARRAGMDRVSGSRRIHALSGDRET